MRLWLRDEELAWKTPDELAELWQQLFYSVTPEEQTFALEPSVRDASKGKGAVTNK